MAHLAPIRVLITGGDAADREAARQALRSRSFAIEDAGGGDAGGSANAGCASHDALVMIDTAQAGREFSRMVAGASKVPVIFVSKEENSGFGRGAAKGSVAQVVPMSRIARLGRAVDRVVARHRVARGQEEVVSDAARVILENHKLIAVGRLTAEIAHEINNPLESVGNLLYLAMNEAGVPERALDFMRLAERELGRVVQISKQTLSFSRESAQPIDVRMTELMDEVLALYSRRIAKKNLQLTREYRTHQAVRALPGELRQVLSNLVTNAIEASANGGRLRLRVRSDRQRSRGRLQAGVRVSVADSGSGMSRETQKKLGQIFFSTKGESGTGLGLWVTKAIVTRYGGSLRMRSRTGEPHGTVFSIFLPSLPPILAPLKDDEPHGKVHAAAKITEISAHPLHVANHGGRERVGSGQAASRVAIKRKG